MSGSTRPRERGVDVLADADPAGAFLSAHDHGTPVLLRTSGTSGTPRTVVRTTTSWVLSFPAVESLTGFGRRVPGLDPGTSHGDDEPVRRRARAVRRCRSWSTRRIGRPTGSSRRRRCTPCSARAPGSTACARWSPETGSASGCATAPRPPGWPSATTTARPSSPSWRGGRTRATSPRSPVSSSRCATASFTCGRRTSPTATPRARGRSSGGADGFATVGDRGILRDGVLTVTGRDDVVLTGGATVHVADVEGSLRGGATGALVVVGIPHPRLGAVVAVALENRDDVEPLRALSRAELDRDASAAPVVRAGPAPPDRGGQGRQGRRRCAGRVRRRRRAGGPVTGRPVIVGGVRTPIGTAGRSLAEVDAADLGAAALAGLRAAAGRPRARAARGRARQLHGPGRRRRTGGHARGRVRRLRARPHRRPAVRERARGGRGRRGLAVQRRRAWCSRVVSSRCRRHRGGCGRRARRGAAAVRAGALRPDRRARPRHGRVERPPCRRARHHPRAAGRVRRALARACRAGHGRRRVRRRARRGR